MQRTFIKSALVGRLLAEHGFKRAPVVRRRAGRATDLRLRPAPHRHHRPAPAAQRRPRAPGARAVADRGAAAAAAARDLGREPDLRRAQRRLLRAPHREPRVHGDPLHGRLERRGVLADPAPVRQVDRLRVARLRPGVLRLAGEAGLDRRLRAAQGQPAADRAQRPREAVGAEEPVAPRRARRDHGGLPRRADRADPPRPGRRDRLGVLALRRGDQGLVDDVRRRDHRPHPARHAEQGGRAVRAGAGGVPRRSSSSTSTTASSSTDPVAHDAGHLRLASASSGPPPSTRRSPRSTPSRARAVAGPSTPTTSPTTASPRTRCGRRSDPGPDSPRRFPLSGSGTVQRERHGLSGVVRRGTSAARRGR